MTIRIEKRAGRIFDWVLLVDGAQNGLYLNSDRAKKGARSFIKAYEGLRWTDAPDGSFSTAEIVRKRKRRSA